MEKPRKAKRKKGQGPAKEGTKWLAPVRSPIDFRRTTITVDSHDEAEAIALESARAYRDARQGTRADSVKEVMQAHIKMFEASRQKTSGVPARKSYVKCQIDPYFEGVAARDVNVQMLHDFARHLIAPASGKGLALTTSKIVMSILRQALTLAKANGVIKKNPMDDYRPFETSAFLRAHQPERPVAMSLAEVRRLLNDTSGMDQLVAHIMLLAGPRSGEAIALRWRHVDDDLKGIWIFDSGMESTLAEETKIRRSAKTKSVAGARFVPGSPKLMAFLAKAYGEAGSPSLDSFVISRVDGDQLGRFGLSYRIRAMQNELAGRTRNAHRDSPEDLGDDTLAHNHLFRHTCVWLMLNAGISIEDVSRYIGHAGPDVTIGHYAHFLRDPDLPLG